MPRDCWEFFQCGREIGGEKVEELGICPAVTASERDGNCSDKNGDRGCAFISGNFCNGVNQGSLKDEEINCIQCVFFRMVSLNDGIASISSRSS